MSDENSSSTNVAVWTAVITAIATVLTAFIGIVPGLRQTDKNTIDDLSSQVAALKAKPPEQAYAVSGSVKTKKDNAPVTNAILDAAAAEDSQPLDDVGNFTFQHMANKPYWIVLETQDGKKARLLITPGTMETASDDIAITYSFTKK